MNQEIKATSLCPSAKCEEGSLLLGLVNKEGQINFLKEKILIDKDFVQIAHTGRVPEARFRFGNKCLKSGCSQWTGERCGVIDRLLDYSKDAELDEQLPECSIRPQCRWFSQNGSEACKVCPYIITDTRDEIILANK